MQAIPIFIMLTRNLKALAPVQLDKNLLISSGSFFLFWSLEFALSHIAAKPTGFAVMAGNHGQAPPSAQTTLQILRMDWAWAGTRPRIIRSPSARCQDRAILVRMPSVWCLTPVPNFARKENWDILGPGQVLCVSRELREEPSQAAPAEKERRKARGSRAKLGQGSHGKEGPPPTVTM